MARKYDPEFLDLERFFDKVERNKLKRKTGGKQNGSRKRKRRSGDYYK